jgi:hypothetical protein
MREQELASLLLTTALERGQTVEQAADLLTTVSLPPFLDQSQFRDQVLSAVASHLRAEVETRISRLREQAGLTPSTTPTPAPSGVINSIPEATVFEAASLASEQIPEPPGDATVFWSHKDSVRPGGDQ